MTSLSSNESSIKVTGYRRSRDHSSIGSSCGRLATSFIDVTCRCHALRTEGRLVTLLARKLSSVIPHVIMISQERVRFYSAVMLSISVYDSVKHTEHIVTVTSLCQQESLAYKNKNKQLTCVICFVNFSVMMFPNAPLYCSRHYVEMSVD